MGVAIGEARTWTGAIDSDNMSRRALRCPHAELDDTRQGAIASSDALIHICPSAVSPFFMFAAVPRLELAFARCVAGPGAPPNQRRSKHRPRIQTCPPGLARLVPTAAPV